MVVMGRCRAGRPCTPASLSTAHIFKSMRYPETLHDRLIHVTYLVILKFKFSFLQINFHEIIKPRQGNSPQYCKWVEVEYSAGKTFYSWYTLHLQQVPLFSITLFTKKILNTGSTSLSAWCWDYALREL